MQNVYLSNYELKEALQIYLKKVEPLNTKTEIVNTWDANGRVTAKAIFALLSSPQYNSSAMDGIA